MSELCSRCGEWSQVMVWQGDQNLCPDCSDDDVLDFPTNGVRGRCDWCRAWSDDLRNRDGKALCGPCDEPLRRLDRQETLKQRQASPRGVGYPSSGFMAGWLMGWLAGVLAIFLGMFTQWLFK